MCGIAGYLLFENYYATKGFISNILTAIEERGKKATGLVCVDPNTKRVTIFKKDGKTATEFIEELPEGNGEIYGRVGILHTRQPTGGEVTDNNNNHPVESEHYWLVHNGCISMQRLKNYNYKGEVDSEILLSWIERMGVRPALKKLSGSAAILLLSKNMDKLYMWRHSSPIVAARFKWGFLFISTEGNLIDTKLTKVGKFGIVRAEYGTLKEHELYEIDITSADYKTKHETVELTYVPTSTYYTYSDAYKEFAIRVRDKIYEKAKVVNALLQEAKFNDDDGDSITEMIPQGFDLKIDRERAVEREKEAEAKMTDALPDNLDKLPDGVVLDEENAMVVHAKEVDRLMRMTDDEYIEHMKKRCPRGSIRGTITYAGGARSDEIILTDEDLR